MQRVMYKMLGRHVCLLIFVSLAAGGDLRNFSADILNAHLVGASDSATASANLIDISQVTVSKVKTAWNCWKNSVELMDRIYK